MFNKERLIKFLNCNHSNVNSELMLIFLKEYADESLLKSKHYDQIMPEILVEIDDTRLKCIKEQLAFECSVASDKEFDFRLQYFKYKLDILDMQQEQQLYDKLLANLTFSKLIEGTNLDLLYQLLFLSTQDLPRDFKGMLSDYIGGVSVYFARKYQLREFALSVLIAINIQEYFEKNFFEHAIEFFEYTQTELGYFGYGNPFNISSDRENQKILNSFYCVLTLERLYNCVSRKVQ